MLVYSEFFQLDKVVLEKGAHQENAGLDAWPYSLKRSAGTVLFSKIHHNNATSYLYLEFWEYEEWFQIGQSVICGKCDLWPADWHVWVVSCYLLPLPPKHRWTSSAKFPSKHLHNIQQHNTTSVLRRRLFSTLLHLAHPTVTGIAPMSGGGEVCKNVTVLN